MTRPWPHDWSPALITTMTSPPAADHTHSAKRNCKTHIALSVVYHISYPKTQGLYAHLSNTAGLCPYHRDSYLNERCCLILSFYDDSKWYKITNYKWLKGGKGRMCLFVIVVKHKDKRRGQFIWWWGGGEELTTASSRETRCQAGVNKDIQ